MNKTDAKKFAYRLVAGFIEELYQAKGGDPLVYDEYFQNWSGAKGAPDFAGRRLSKEDKRRVEVALNDLYVEINRKGWAECEAYLSDWGYHERCAFKWPRPAGKPGARWSKYKAWLKRQGRA